MDFLIAGESWDLLRAASGDLASSNGGRLELLIGTDGLYDERDGGVETVPGSER